MEVHAIAKTVSRVYRKSEVYKDDNRNDDAATFQYAADGKIF
jgi:hypothetical protein